MVRIINDKIVRNQVALTVRPALDFIGVGNEIQGFQLSSSGVRFEQVPRR